MPLLIIERFSASSGVASNVAHSNLLEPSMGIFFRSKPVFRAVRVAVEDALRLDPSKVPNIPDEATTRATAVQLEVQGEFLYPAHNHCRNSLS